MGATVLDLRLPERYAEASLLTAQDNRRVVRCRIQETGEWIALKCLLPPFAEEAAEAFRQEYLRLEAIDHPNWVRPGRFFSLPEGGYAFELELSAGRPLLEVPWRGWCPEVVEIGRQILSGLHAIHVLGVAHLDLKPDQVLVSWEEGDGGAAGEEDAGEVDPGRRLTARIRVHLLDLGLSQPFGTPIPPTGTPGYMAPEILRGERNWDARVDLYAFGAIVHELLWNEEAFPGATAGEKIRAQIAGKVWPRERESGGARREGGMPTPRAIVTLCAESIEPNPDDRPRDVHEIWTRMREVATAHGWPGSGSLAQGEALPFLGRERETAEFVQRWRRLGQLDPESAVEFVIEAERYERGTRLRDRWVAVAQTLGGVREAADWVRHGGGALLSIATRALPPCRERRESRMSEAAGTVGSPSSGWVLQLGCHEEIALGRLARSQGVTSEALTQYLLDLSQGREVLLGALIDATPESIRTYSWSQGIEFDRGFWRVPPPDVAVEWCREVLAEMAPLERVAWVRDAVLTIARDPKWCFPPPILVNRTTNGITQVARWVVEVTPLSDRIDATHELWAEANAVECALLGVSAGLTEVPQLEEALRQLNEGGYFDTGVRLVVEASRRVPAEGLVTCLPPLLDLLVITARVRFPPPYLDPEMARELDARVGMRLLEPIALLSKGDAEAARASLDPVPPSTYPASEIWLNLRRELGYGDDPEVRATLPLPTHFEAVSWREARDLEDAPIESVRSFIGALLERTEDLPRTWRILMWVSLDALVKGDIVASRAAIEEAITCGRRWSRGTSAASSYMNLANIESELGRHERASQLLLAVVDEGRLLQIERLYTVAINNLCNSVAVVGRLGDSIRFAESARLSRAVGSGVLSTWVRCGWLEEVVSEAERPPSVFELRDEDVILLTRQRAVALVLLGDSSGRVTLGQLVELHRERQDDGDLVDTIADWLQAELDLGADPHSPLLTALQSELRSLLPRVTGSTEFRTRLVLLQHAIVTGDGDQRPLGAELASLVAEVERCGVEYYRWRTAWLALQLASRDAADATSLGGAQARLREALANALRGLVATFDDPRAVRRFLGLPGVRRAVAAATE